MTDCTNTMELDELTQDFLSSLPSRAHMSWTEWQKEAEAYGLDENEIAELEKYLETNNQLTSPMRFAGRQWWLTKREIEHVELIKQYFPSNWETEVLDGMQSKKLGDTNKDWRLTEQSQAKDFTQQ